MSNKWIAPSPPIYKSNLRRYWPGAALMLFTYIVAALVIYTDISNNRWYEINESINTNTDAYFITESGAAIAAGIFAFMAGIIAAMLCFRYIMEHRMAVMSHSLPIRRETHLITAAASGLTLLGAPIIIGGLLFFTVFAANGIYAPFETFQWILANLSIACLGFSIAAFFAMTTGNTIAHGILTLVFMNLPLLVEGVIIAYSERFLFGFVAWEPVTLKINPFYHIVDYFERVSRNYRFNIPQSLLAPVVFLLVSAALLFLTALIYRRRKIETAGDVIALRQVRPFLRYGAALGFAFLFGFIYVGVTNGGRNIAIIGELCFSILGGAFGFFVAEMFIRRTAHVFKRGIYGALAFALAFVLMYLTIYFDLPGYGSMKLDPQKIELIAIGSYNSRVENALFGDPLNYHKTMSDLDIDDPDGLLAGRRNNYYYVVNNPLPPSIARQILDQDLSVMRGGDINTAVDFQHYIAGNSMKLLKESEYYDNIYIPGQSGYDSRYYNIPFIARYNDGRIIRRNYNIRMFFERSKNPQDIGTDNYLIIENGSFEYEFLSKYITVLQHNYTAETGRIVKCSEKADLVSIDITGDRVSIIKAPIDKYGDIIIEPDFYDDIDFFANDKYIPLDQGERGGLFEAYSADAASRYEGLSVYSKVERYREELSFYSRKHRPNVLAQIHISMPDNYAENVVITHDDNNSIMWLIERGILTESSMELFDGL